MSSSRTYLSSFRWLISSTSREKTKMIRVIYETRLLDDSQSKPIRCSEIVPGSALNVRNSTLRGQPVKIISYDECRDPKQFKTHTAIRPSNRRSFADLKKLLNRHYRRSSWKELVAMVIDDFIKDLEWEEVLKDSGYRTKPFSYHWHQFKKQYLAALQWSPSTQKMLPRLEQQDWLRSYLEKEE